MGLKEFAKRELTLAGLFDKDSSYGGMTAEAVMELIDLFSKQGHSGGSASQVIQVFSQLANFKPLTPITEEDSEWSNDIDSKTFQNSRCSALFKKNGKAYYLDAIIWRTPSGSTWSGRAYTREGKAVYSRQYVRFPFIPKSFYIDVDEIEDSKDSWTFIIKDEKQLEAVFNYYDEYKEEKVNESE